MSYLRILAFLAALPFVLIGLPLMAYACGVKLDRHDTISSICRKLG